MSKWKNLTIASKNWREAPQYKNLDWDARGMIIHLFSLLAEQEASSIPDFLDEANILLVLGNPDANDWNLRLKKQITIGLSWKLLNSKSGSIRKFPDHFSASEVLCHPLLIGNKRGQHHKALDTKFGFQITDILKFAPTSTILYTPPKEHSGDTVWDDGVKLLGRNNMSALNARVFLGKMIKQYGQNPVADAIKQMSSLKQYPADARLYMQSILQTAQKAIRAKNGRGSVSL